MEVNTSPVKSTSYDRFRVHPSPKFGTRAKTLDQEILNRVPDQCALFEMRRLWGAELGGRVSVVLDDAAEEDVDARRWEIVAVPQEVVLRLH